ncbi:MAG: glutamine cyclotransferase [Bacteroidetes bacterium]|nr:MAG: glutamine cyclotransferase [Bacteroidota bacterium]
MLFLCGFAPLREILKLISLLRISLILLIGFALACNSNNSSTPEPTHATPSLNYSVVAIYPHDTTSYTEGLLFHDGQLYESEGYYERFPQSRSIFGPVDLKSGKINVKAELDKQKYFGEGIAFLNDKVYQLTYKTKIGFIYDAKSFQKIGEFTFPSNEGWGMTTDGHSLIMSDGSEHLTWLDPVKFQTQKTITVMDENGIVINLNELEWIKGSIYANVYGTNDIVKIDPQSGKVLARLNLGTLTQDAKTKFPGCQELNGIAYDSTSGNTMVTGKLWPNIYEIKFPY